MMSDDTGNDMTGVDADVLAKAIERRLKVDAGYLHEIADRRLHYLCSVENDRGLLQEFRAAYEKSGANGIFEVIVEHHVSESESEDSFNAEMLEAMRDIVVDGFKEAHAAEPRAPGM